MSKSTVSGHSDEEDLPRPLNEWDEYLADCVEEARRRIVAPSEQRARLIGLAQRIGVLTSEGLVASDLTGEGNQARRAALLRALRDLALMVSNE